MAGTPSTVTALHNAITAFRKQCGDDDDCERILVLADATETEIESAYPDEEDKGGNDEPDDDTPVEKQPKTLSGAQSEVRSRMRAARK